MSEIRALSRRPTEPDKPPGRPKVTWGKNYTHPSDGSTLKLLKEPCRMTSAQVVSWAEFNRR